MRTHKKPLFLILVMILILTTITPFSISAMEKPPVNQANEKVHEIILYYYNASSTQSYFNIIGNQANIVAIYEGYHGVTTGATIEIKVQKKTLFWWFDVDNSQANNTWVDTFTTTSGTASHTLTLSKTGEYRTTITYTIYGTGGSADIITTTLYDDYN